MRGGRAGGRARERTLRYSKRAEKPVRSCPVLWTAYSAGVAMQRVSAAPGRTPAAVDWIGSEATEQPMS